MKGWRALFYKEILRFWKVSFQTIAAPVLSAVLYLLIFGHVLEDRVQVYDQLKYTSFLLPGLIMMSLLQNAFANSSSSMVQSKIMGNLVFILLSPLGHCGCLSEFARALESSRAAFRLQKLPGEQGRFLELCTSIRNTPMACGCIPSADPSCCMGNRLGRQVPSSKACTLDAWTQDS